MDENIVARTIYSPIYGMVLPSKRTVNVTRIVINMRIQKIEKWNFCSSTSSTLAESMREITADANIENNSHMIKGFTKGDTLVRT